MVESTTNVPSEESLNQFHDDINAALTKLQTANDEVKTYIVCGSAFQIMLNFIYTWMVQSRAQGNFVEFMTTQAKQFLQLRAMTEANKG